MRKEKGGQTRKTNVEREGAKKSKFDFFLQNLQYLSTVDGDGEEIRRALSGVSYPATMATATHSKFCMHIN
jgi:hypothetical protein